MIPCRHCGLAFEPEGISIFCSAECTIEANKRRQFGGTMTATPVEASPVSHTAATMDEETLQQAIIDLGREFRWKAYHTRNSRKSKAGFPDLTMWRERVIFVEVKAEAGELSAAQITTLEELRAAGAEVYVWRPRDWAELVKVLTNEQTDTSSEVARGQARSGEVDH